MNGLALLLALMALPLRSADSPPPPPSAPVAEPAAPVPASTDTSKPEPGKLNALYEEAFQHYRAGEYNIAIKTWNQILHLDPEQKTARHMISDIRLELMRKNRTKLETLFALVHQGRYQKALVALQTLIEEDETHPRYKILQASLGEVSAMLPQAPMQTKAWRMAVLGMSGVLGPQEDTKLAYNGLRYAIELDPNEDMFRKFYHWLLSKHPELSGVDVVTPGMRFMEYKQLNGINFIYDGKYNQAVDTLNEILALEPQDLLALKRLGSAYYSMGHSSKARDAWIRAQRLAPDDAQLNKFLRKLAAGKTQ